MERSIPEKLRSRCENVPETGTLQVVLGMTNTVDSGYLTNGALDHRDEVYSDYSQASRVLLVLVATILRSTSTPPSENQRAEHPAATSNTTTETNNNPKQRSPE